MQIAARAGIALEPISLPRSWLAMGGLLCLGLLADAASGVVVHGLDGSAICIAMVLACAALLRPWGWGGRVALALELTGLLLAFTPAALALSYASARTGATLRDDALIRADALLGFDWRAWHDAVHPAAPVLLLAYRSLVPQMVLSCWVLPLVGRGERAVELLWMETLAAMACCAVAALLPALGAFAHFGLPDPGDWVPDLLALRTGAPFTLDLLHGHGLIAFPSFHAAMAVLLAFSARRTGLLGWLVAALDLLMLASTPGNGGHYLADVIAGCALAGLCIVAVRHGRPGAGAQERCADAGPVSARPWPRAGSWAASRTQGQAARVLSWPARSCPRPRPDLGA